MLAQSASLVSPLTSQRLISSRHTPSRAGVKTAAASMQSTQLKSLKAVPITPENFKPFGQVNLPFEWVVCLHEYLRAWCVCVCACARTCTCVCVLRVFCVVRCVCVCACVCARVEYVHVSVPACACARALCVCYVCCVFLLSSFSFSSRFFGLNMGNHEYFIWSFEYEGHSL